MSCVCISISIREGLTSTNVYQVCAQYRIIIVLCYTAAYIEASPSSQTARPGEWVNFTCGIQCSQADLVAWFLNDSMHSLYSKTLAWTFNTIHSTPILWYKSDNWHRKSHIITDDNSGVGFPLDVYCVVISGCEDGALNLCTSYTCSSETAHFKIQSKCMITFYYTPADWFVLSFATNSDKWILSMPINVNC